MPQQKSKNTDINPWAAMDEIVKQSQEPNGPEWFTVLDFANRYKVSRKCAQERLQRMFEDGVLKRWFGLSEKSRRITAKYALLNKSKRHQAWLKDEKDKATAQASKRQSPSAARE